MLDACAVSQGGKVKSLAEQRLDLVLELSREWYWEQDESYRFTLFLGAGANHAAVDLEPYIGSTRWSGDAEPVGDDGSWDAHKAVLDARQSFREFQFRRIDPNGELRYFSTSGEPVFEDRRFIGYRGIARDVTARQRAEQLLRLEHSVARCIAGSDAPPEALKTVLRAIWSSSGTSEAQAWKSSSSSRAGFPMHRASASSAKSCNRAIRCGSPTSARTNG
jgi:hypothetical protein